MKYLGIYKEYGGELMFREVLHLYVLDILNRSRSGPYDRGRTFISKKLVISISSNRITDMLSITVRWSGECIDTFSGGYDYYTGDMGITLDELKSEYREKKINSILDGI